MTQRLESKTCPILSGYSGKMNHVTCISDKCVFWVEKSRKDILLKGASMATTVIVKDCVFLKGQF